MTFNFWNVWLLEDTKRKMTDKKNSADKKKETSDEMKRSKTQKKLRKESEEKAEFSEILEELLEDEEIYHLLQKLKDWAELRLSTTLCKRQNRYTT